MPTPPSHRYNRPSWDRMIRIHEWIRAGRFPNSPWMAKELGVSVRTVKRDVEFLMDRWNLPIAYDKRRYGYYYTKPVERFPALPITEAEVFAMLVAHKAIAQYQGTPFQKPLEMAFRKLTGQLDSRGRYSVDNFGAALSFRPFAPEDTDLRMFQTVTRALQERREMTFQYKNLGARNFLSRRVRPYHLACIDNHWYLFAFDTVRGAMRTFALTRLSEPRLMDEQFEVPKDFDPDEYLKGSLSVFKGNHDYEIVIEFDVWATDLARGRQWHASQEFTELPGGMSRIRMRLNSLEEIERWVLAWGTHATVIRPEALADRIRNIGQALADRYSTTAEA